MSNLMELSRGRWCLVLKGKNVANVRTEMSADGIHIFSDAYRGNTSGSPSLLDDVQGTDPSKLRQPLCSSKCCCARFSGSASLDAVHLWLAYKNIVGAVWDKASETVRIVHCSRPDRSGSGRTRADVVLNISDSSCDGTQEEYAFALEQAEAWARQVTERCVISPCHRHYLVFINPTSGNGHAMQKWAIAKKLWKDLPWITFEEIVTNRLGHASDHIREADLSTVSGIIIVSGDGLVHEVLNGLAFRPDATLALQLPVGHIPAGSGNGLAKSVLHLSGEDYGVLDSAFLIAKGGRKPLNLMSVTSLGMPPRVSFLSLSAGIIAEIDIESEFMRCIGSLRFTIYAVYRLLVPRTQRAKLVYWPAEAESRPSCAEPAVDAPLPEGPWVTIDSDLTIFWGMNTAWAAHDNHTVPGADLSDGVWSLVVLRNVGRKALLDFLLAMDSGGHVDQDAVEIIRCRALRFTPMSEGGRICLDGENVPLSPIQVWPMDSSAMVIGG
eukprot:TRINITY_DN76954_c0_g1_i1.p1 TRINITY_DN76954_c0_g1~~TRINITY_DN76954_c0_g1_i1.p1  ORF type:complete len:496 (+),score=58.53 TRINITY_DN76954_c0_g1_i1:101-1588(+)